MRGQFRNITPEAMRGLAEQFAVDLQGRRLFLDRTRRATQALCVDFREQQQQRHVQRRHSAAHQADGRRLFMNDLRSGVHALKTRLSLQRRHNAAEQADDRRLFMSELRSGVHALKTKLFLERREMVDDLERMRSDLQAATAAFRERIGGQARYRCGNANAGDASRCGDLFSGDAASPEHGNSRRARNPHHG